MENVDLVVQIEMALNKKQMLIGKLVKVEQIQVKLLQVLKLIDPQKRQETSQALVEILPELNI